MARSLLLSLILLFAGCSGGDSEAAREARFQRDLATASDQARAQLGWFWERFAAPAPDEYDFLVRADFPHGDGPDDVESLWVEVTARTPETDAITGFLASEPLIVADLKKGDPVTLSGEDVIDWAFFQGDQLLGHYTTRVQLPRMPVDQAEALRSLLGENPK